MENTRTGAPWSAEEIHKLKYMFVHRKATEDIAKELGRSYMAIVTRLRKIGLMDDLGRNIEEKMDGIRRSLRVPQEASKWN